MLTPLPSTHCGTLSTLCCSDVLRCVRLTNVPLGRDIGMQNKQSHRVVKIPKLPSLCWAPSSYLWAENTKEGEGVLVPDHMGHNYFSIFDSKRGQSTRSHRFWASVIVFSPLDILTHILKQIHLCILIWVLSAHYVPVMEKTHEAGDRGPGPPPPRTVLCGCWQVLHGITAWPHGTMAEITYLLWPLCGCENQMKP